MIDQSMSGQAYNRFDNLDGIDSRIIYYLFSYNNKTKEEKQQVDVLRKLIVYQNVDALEGVRPSGKQISSLISNDETSQSTKRIFRSPYLDDSIDVRGSMLKVYIDSIIPETPMTAIVNIAVEAISNVQDINIKIPTPIDEDDVTEDLLQSINESGYQNDGNIYIDKYESNDNPDSYDDTDLYETDAKGNLVISYESRVSAMTKSILYLLNGASVQGVGKLVFSRKLNIFNQAQYGLWSRRKYEGMKIVMGVRMSGVS